MLKTFFWDIIIREEANPRISLLLAAWTLVTYTAIT